jgi:hypothetical protein
MVKLRLRWYLNIGLEKSIHNLICWGTAVSSCDQLHYIPVSEESCIKFHSELLSNMDLRPPERRLSQWTNLINEAIFQRLHFVSKTTNIFRQADHLVQQCRTRNMLARRQIISEQQVHTSEDGGPALSVDQEITRVLRHPEVNHLFTTHSWVLFRARWIQCMYICSHT